MYFDSALRGVVIGHSDPGAVVAAFAERSGQDPRLARQRFTLMREACRPERLRALMAEGERLNREHRRQGATAAQRRLNDLKRRHAELDHRWAVAIHEAGHAVAAAVLNVPGIVSASIQPNGDSSGRVLFVDSHKSPPMTAAIVALSGGAAEAKLSNREFRDVPASDSADFARACDRAGAQCEVVRAGAKGEAVALVKRHWQAIDALARELVVEKRVGCDRIRGIVAEHRA